MRRAIALPLALLALAGLVSCGGSGGDNEAAPRATTANVTTTTSSAPTRQELAQTYLRIVRPGNEAIDEFRAKSAKWNDNTTGEQAAKDAAPLIAAMEKADNELLRVNWPAETRADVKELVTAHGAVIGDLQALESVNLLSAGDFANQLSQDSGKMAAAVNIVRADLGLPPAK